MRESIGNRWVTILCAAAALAGIAAEGQVTVLDVGVATDFQDIYHGHFNRGRSLVAADFDNDGDNDFFVGNPGDTSFILRNEPVPGGRFRLEHHQLLHDSALAWGAAASDYDNDGDIDLFVAAGGNECAGWDVLFQNQLMESGVMEFVDVTDFAGLAAPLLPGFPVPRPMGSGNAVWGDVDQDGDNDLFVNGNGRFGCANVPVALNRNTLWLNNGDGTFTDSTEAVSLHDSLHFSRHSTLFDFDGDSDLDLFEQNWLGPNALWRNQLIETGALGFEDVTAEMSFPGEDLSFPYVSFVSCAADFDNDGFEDLMVFARGNNDHPDLDCGGAVSEPMSMPEAESPYGNGHALFMNQSGAGFINEAAQTGINTPFIDEAGVMGSQLGDVNGDGAPDIYIGNGSPGSGQLNQLFLSTQGAFSPTFENRTDLIDFAAPHYPNAPPNAYPSYPYRTHGTVIVDADGDGRAEVLVSNGGPAARPNRMREPNRAFKFIWDEPFSHLRVRLEGDGVAVSRDAIGARVRVTASSGGGETWDVYRTLYGGSCFSAQNGFELLFGLADADTIHEIEVRWPDGVVETLDQGLSVDSIVTIARQ